MRRADVFQAVRIEMQPLLKGLPHIGHLRLNPRLHVRDGIFNLLGRSGSRIGRAVKASRRFVLRRNLDFGF